MHRSDSHVGHTINNLSHFIHLFIYFIYFFQIKVQRQISEAYTKPKWTSEHSPLIPGFIPESRSAITDSWLCIHPVHSITFRDVQVNWFLASPPIPSIQSCSAMSFSFFSQLQQWTTMNNNEQSNKQNSFYATLSLFFSLFFDNDKSQKHGDVAEIQGIS